MHDLTELLTRAEPLSPSLRPYVINNRLGPMIQHPLIQEIMYRKEMNALINERYRQKIAALDKAIANKRWHSVIFIHERPWRFDALTKYADRMTDEDYWACVGSVWVDSENIWQHYDAWRTLWESNRPGRLYAMEDDEQEVFTKLPEVITVYRGVHGMGIHKARKRTGLSWTLDRDKADWFMGRYRQYPQKLLEGTVKKADVHAYFGGRNEQEIVATRVKVT